MPAQSVSHPCSIFDLLGRDDLDSVLLKWTGEKIFRRGLDYFRSGNVANLVVAKNDTLLATVHGTRDYASALYLDETGRLAGACNCPYHDNCKHLVALAFEARETLRGGNVIPQCGDFDYRLAKLPALFSQTPLPNLRGLKKSLASLDKDELLNLLLQACKLDRKVFLLCASGADPGGIGLRTLAGDVKKAIANAANVPDFEENYSDWPDYMEIAQNLRAILAADNSEIVLELAQNVFASCENVIEACHYDRELIDGVARITETALAALQKTGWTPAQRLLWVIDTLLRNRGPFHAALYSWLDGISDTAAWRCAEARLAVLERENRDSYRKNAVRALRKLALEKSCQYDALQKIYEEEGRESNDYLPLVDFLLERGDEAEAEKWMYRAVENAKKYQAEGLRQRLKKLREKENNPEAKIIDACENFVDYPGVDEYETCRTLASNAGQWEILRPLLMQFLTNGKLPWHDERWPWRYKGAASLPYGKFPLYHTLEELALYENRPLDALALFDQQQETRVDYNISEVLLANAIAPHAPERAVAFWKAHLERLIEERSSKRYLEAGQYLRKIIFFSAQMGKTDHLRPYLAGLRARHQRKKNFIKILDAVERENNLSR